MLINDVMCAHNDLISGSDRLGSDRYLSSEGCVTIRLTFHPPPPQAYVTFLWPTPPSYTRIWYQGLIIMYSLEDCVKIKPTCHPPYPMYHFYDPTPSLHLQLIGSKSCSLTHMLWWGRLIPPPFPLRIVCSPPPPPTHAMNNELWYKRVVQGGLRPSKM